MAKATRKAASKKTTTKTTAKSSGRSTIKATSKMTFKTSGSGAGGSREVDCFGMSLSGWVEEARAWSAGAEKMGARGWVVFVGESDGKKAFASVRKQWGAQMNLLSKPQQDSISKWFSGKKENDSLSLQLKEGLLFLVRILDGQSSTASRDPLVKSNFARARDVAGSVYQSIKSAKLEKLIVDLSDASRDEASGFLVGLEMAAYSFAEAVGFKSKTEKPDLVLRATDAAVLKEVQSEASRLGVAVNLARHLTNLPGGTLTPATYADFATDLFRSVSTVNVDVWEEERMKSENMNLHLAVGQGADAPPRLVHMSYRPRERGAESKPVALVGKGITFDSGGLDIKPSSGMRLMKKDMGGSAAVIALTWWAASSGLPLAIDSYLALAENAVSAKSFRPGDIIKSRRGLAIEIHNTDAEGRLVLADALDVAIEAEGDNEPACLIDLATLTGAIKVGLGGEIAGLFTNSDDLAREIFDAGLKRGDLSWRMPLFQPYKNMLRSPYADHVNASDGFAGAITAALFLELFAENKKDGRMIPWAHLDIYAWRDSASGAWTEPGGSGQGVLALSEVLGRFVAGKWAEG